MSIDKLYQKYYLPSFQGYGDFVICLYILKLFDDDKNSIRVIASDNCRDLGNSLGMNSFIDYINISGPNGYPSFIDIRRQGIILGLKNLIDIRNKISELKKNKIIFHSFKLKESLIGLGKNTKFLKGNDNIYLNYIKFFKKNNYKENYIKSDKRNKKETNIKVKIFPVSQNNFKSIPYEIQIKLSNILDQLNIDHEFIYLTGEEIGFEKITRKKILNKTFDDLTNEIKISNFIISCDSLTAHLGEYFNKEVFVLFSRPNKYWLPLSAHELENWATFDNVLNKSKFISTISTFFDR